MIINDVTFGFISIDLEGVNDFIKHKIKKKIPCLIFELNFCDTR